MIKRTLASCTIAFAEASSMQRTRLHARETVRDDMIEVAGATYLLGRADSRRPDEGPAHLVHVAPFHIDRTLVTRREFARFVEAKRHRTTAERRGWGQVAEEGMDDWAWERVAGASWRRPYKTEGVDTKSFEQPEAPVVMVSYDDAAAFCSFRGKRLPTEHEWVLAMRDGNPNRLVEEAPRFPWGNDRRRADGTPGHNAWEGTSHHTNERHDGYVYVSPVRAFPPNARGVYDAVGNVWQWTSTPYVVDAYASEARGEANARTKGASEGMKYTLRGGSWWCGKCACEGDGLHYRGKAPRDATFNNVGFRCARDAHEGPE